MSQLCWTRTLLARCARLWGTGLVLIGAWGCGGGLQLTRINSEQKKPNNVWVFFSVQRGDEPVPGLTAEDFRIYEDDGRVSPYESQQLILNPEVASVMYTLLLLDVSASITESGKVGALVDAAELFVERVGKTQRVAVYAFDGAEQIHAIVPFTEAERPLRGGLTALRRYRARDPSTNLHGAVARALERLDQGLAREKKPLKFGTLVVFSDGADRAARVSRAEMIRAIEAPEHERYELFAIGIGDEAELTRAKLDDIGRNGPSRATTPPRSRRRSTASPAVSKRTANAFICSRIALQLARESTTCASRSTRRRSPVPARSSMRSLPTASVRHRAATPVDCQHLAWTVSTRELGPRQAPDSLRHPHSPRDRAVR